MKTVFVRDLLANPAGVDVSLSAWVATRRKGGNVVFLDLVDSTGKIQAIFDRSQVGPEVFVLAETVPTESAIHIRGRLETRPQNPHDIRAHTMELIGADELRLSPQPRTARNVFDSGLADHVLHNRHLYIRNPKSMAILRFRSALMSYVRSWFEANNFLEIDAPVLTAVPLYEDGSAVSLQINDETVYLTQCVGYYLEAAVHAFERVYNMGPSFRGEESRSKRHLMEYWHIKAEIAFADLDDIIGIVESVISMVSRQCWALQSDVAKILGTSMCLDGMELPFPRISYEEAARQLRADGFAFEFGTSLGSAEEAALSRQFQQPFWITGIPRTIEPFPYVIDPDDPRVTRVADLIATNGYGELLGVAEKISSTAMLDERMQEKGKFQDPRYEWIRDVHRSGCVPHAAFGMGLERLIRWLLNIEHVRDAAAFPRIFRRRIFP